MHPAIDSSAYNKNQVNTEECGQLVEESKKVRLAKRPKAIIKPYISRWREICSDSDGRK